MSKYFCLCEDIVSHFSDLILKLDLIQIVSTNIIYHFVEYAV